MPASTIQSEAEAHLTPGAEIDCLVAATRETLDAVLVMELRLASIASITERFGARYAKAATAELQHAAEQVHLAESRRRNVLAAAASALRCAETARLDDIIELAPEPSRSALASVRAELMTARARIEILRAKAEDTLGRRITLVAEALRPAGSEPEATYGRVRRPTPRLVRSRL